MDDAALAVWLRLREQADWKVRSVVLTQAVVARLPHERPLGVLDLGTGAGSNVRYLAGRLPMPQRWLLIDRSAALLSEAEVRTRAWAVERGARWCYLQVVASNDPARALYRRLGFIEHHRYHYRRPPVG